MLTLKQKKNVDLEKGLGSGDHGRDSFFEADESQSCQAIMIIRLRYKSVQVTPSYTE